MVNSEKNLYASPRVTNRTTNISPDDITDKPYND